MPAAGPARFAQLSSSIFLSGDWDYLPYNDTTGASRCTDMVDRWCLFWRER